MLPFFGAEKWLEDTGFDFLRNPAARVLNMNPDLFAVRFRPQGQDFGGSTLHGFNGILEEAPNSQAQIGITRPEGRQGGREFPDYLDLMFEKKIVMKKGEALFE